MDIKSAKLFAAEMDKNIPCLDLHGFYPDEAVNKLDIFLYENYSQKCSAVRVVYGGGTGRLREVILAYLSEHDLAETVKDEGGSAVVVLSINP
jgi:dsDNA-specific endonuclease/ATPase MutS2